MEPVWDAVRFEHAMPRGRTKPLLIECARQVGGREERARFVVKALGLPGIQAGALCHEFLGCRLARLYGLAAPNAEVVQLSPEFLASAADDLRRARVKPDPGLAVGVELVANLDVFPASARLHPAEVLEAARVYVFDLLIQNPDRRAENPNSGRADGRIVPFDFENGFSFRLAIPGGDQWRISHLPFCRGHLFHEALRERAPSIDWPDAFAPFEEAPDGAVADACGTIPPAWSAVGAEIHAHFEAVFAHWPQFKQDVLATLGVSV